VVAFGLFVGQVALGRCQLGLAGFAGQGEVVEGLEVGGWDYGLGLLALVLPDGAIIGRS
jgi:hypothetical protein